VTSTQSTNTGLFDFGNRKLIAGQLYTVCERNLPDAWSTNWQLDGVSVGPYNPDASLTPPQDLGTRCFDFRVDPGRTRTFTINNLAPPGGGQRTIGYWKNWNKCTSGNQSKTAAKNGGAAKGFFLMEDLLPQRLDSYLTISDCQTGVKILSKQDIRTGKLQSNDAAYGLAAQLLAAQLNVAAGSSTCPTISGPATGAIAQAQSLLGKIKFSGTGSFLVKASSDRTTALDLANLLDNYNNGRVC
jgi:hypothetical protein